MKQLLVFLLAWVCAAGFLTARAGDIHTAARQGDAVLVSALLLDDPSLVNRRERAFGYTPLHLAVAGGHLDVVRVLVARGADLNLTARSGCSPLKLAIGLGKDRIADFLSEAGARVIAPPRVVVIPPPMPLIVPERVPSRPAAVGGRTSRRGGGGYEHVGSECEACGKPVPKNLGLGDQCPHCGVIWGGVRQRYLN